MQVMFNMGGEDSQPVLSALGSCMAVVAEDPAKENTYPFRN